MTEQNHFHFRLCIRSYRWRTFLYPLYPFTRHQGEFLFSMSTQKFGNEITFKADRNESSNSISQSQISYRHLHAKRFYKKDQTFGNSRTISSESFGTVRNVLRFQKNMRESWKEWIPDALLMISRKKKRKYISRLKDHCKTGVFCNDYVELTPLTSSGLQDFHNICMSTFF